MPDAIPVVPRSTGGRCLGHAVPSARARSTLRFGQAVPVVPATPGLPDSPLPVPQVVPVLPAPSLLPVRPLTVNEFVSAFKPLPGQYEVLLVHPKTGCPVKVCFTLKPGCIRTVRVERAQDRLRLRQAVRCRDSLPAQRQSVGTRLNRAGERGV